MTDFPMRQPCPDCGGTAGAITRKSGQDVVRCANCDRYCYNAPRTETLLADLKAMIVDGAAEHPRHQQSALGPSEIGIACDRRLALAMYGAPKINTSDNPLPSIIGVGAHAQFEEFAHRANRRIGHKRWLPEFRVTVRPGLSGTCDLIDLQTMTVIDHKVPGATSILKYRNHGPSNQYRVQAHLYGRGARNEGLPIETVAICFVPAGGRLKDSFVWSEPYSDQIVDNALGRIDSILATMYDLDVDHHPDRFAYIQANTENCYFCPFFRAGAGKPGPLECAGNRAPDAISALAAK